MFPLTQKLIIAEPGRMTGLDDEGENEIFLFIDTIDLAKQIADHGPYSLPAVLDQLGLDNSGAHAAAEAITTVNTLHALFGFKRGEIRLKSSVKAKYSVPPPPDVQAPPPHGLPWVNAGTGRRSVDRASMRLHDGYGFVRGEAFCKPDKLGMATA